MLGFGLCLWQQNNGPQIPPYVGCQAGQPSSPTSMMFVYSLFEKKESVGTVAKPTKTRS